MAWMPCRGPPDQGRRRHVERTTPSILDGPLLRHHSELEDAEQLQHDSAAVPAILDTASRLHRPVKTLSPWMSKRASD